MRPAIIVSNNLSNSLDADLLICPITTQIRNEYFSFFIDNQYLTTPLPFVSEIWCNKIATIRASLAIKKISSLKQEKRDELIALIINALQPSGK